MIIIAAIIISLPLWAFVYKEESKKMVSSTKEKIKEKIAQKPQVKILEYVPPQVKEILERAKQGLT